MYDPATGSNTQVTHHGPDEAFLRAAWSPDGTSLAISLLDWTTERGDVCLSTWDGSSWSTPVNLTADWADSSEDLPSWSPDGKNIVFQSNKTGDLDIWYMPVNDPTNRVNITNTPGLDETAPSWAPVPEPSTLVLWSLFGMVGVGYAWWRKRPN